MPNRKRLFGTDGIRGKANHHPMTAEIALKVGMAAGQQFLRGGHRHRVVIAKDTRLSGYMIEPALVAGFIAVGMDVVLVGPLPTPAVAMLVRSLRADLGVMISASHNPYHDNGIKLFGPDGFKLSDEVEHKIEQLIEENKYDALAGPDKLGRAKRLDDAGGRYIEYCKNTFPKNLTLDGLKVVIDCAHGAAYHVAPLILSELGAEVITICAQPNGFNINELCGSTSPKQLQARVIAEKADIGIALDGDADRLIICDENGNIVDGDQLMAIIATHCQSEGTLTGGGIVATQMSNLGLERYLDSIGLTMPRTKVGDRYVVEHMRKHGFNVGGEQSGHLIFTDHSTTGDGIIAALQILAFFQKKGGKKFSQQSQLFKPMPQMLKNVPVKSKATMEHADVKTAIETAEKKLAGKGRVLVRPSGTEPVVRVMAEGDDLTQVEAIIDEIALLISRIPV
ncbi:MAG: phosphoglucosamine mutase [Alphaproteobacteria bacterium]|nr:phosphoglucosamine mutase [Alphaproteobacteria bacterium]